MPMMVISMAPCQTGTMRTPRTNDYYPESEEELSLGPDEFDIPEEPLEDPRLQAYCRRLISTAKSMKLKSQKLRDEQDRLNDKWTEVLNAEQEIEDRLAGNNKYYPQRKLLPEFDEEVDGSLLSKREWAENPDRPPRGRDRPAGGYPNPPEIPRRYSKDPLPPLKPYDLRKKLASRPAAPSRSIYGSRERPPAGQAGYLAWSAKMAIHAIIHVIGPIMTSDVRHATARV